MRPGVLCIVRPASPALVKLEKVVDLEREGLGVGGEEDMGLEDAAVDDALFKNDEEIEADGAGGPPFDFKGELVDGCKL